MTHKQILQSSQVRLRKRLAKVDKDFCNALKKFERERKQIADAMMKLARESKQISEELARRAEIRP